VEGIELKTPGKEYATDFLTEGKRSGKELEGGPRRASVGRHPIRRERTGGEA